MRLLTALALLLAAAAPATAAILPVHPDGSGDYPTIQAAIEAAAEGDSVLLADGVFSGPGNRDLRYLGKAITVASAAGDPTLCVIDCGGSAVEFHRGVSFIDGEGASSVLAGITIRGGWADDPDDRGGGILIGYAARPRIERCVVRDCRADLGGALYGEGYGAPTLVDCDFVGNTAGACAGVALNNEGRPQVIGCRFIENECSWGGALAFASLATLARADELTPSLAATQLETWQPPRDEGDRSWPQLTVEGCLFDRNTAEDWIGAGIYFFGDQLILRDTVIAHSWGDGWGDGGCGLGFDGNPEHPSLIEGASFVANSCDEGGATAIRIYGGSLEISRSLFADSGYCEAIDCYDSGAVVQLSCCNLFTRGTGEWEGCTADQYGMNGNFDANPLLCGPHLGDYHLDQRSPCLPANNACGVLVGALGEGCDLYDGSYYVRADGTGDFPTIQAALDAPFVEEVILADGVYTGHSSTELDFHGLPISLRSESGDPSRCLIDRDDAPGFDVVFRFDDNEGPAAEVIDIGIRDGDGLSVISCWNSSPSFRGLLISNASSSDYGIVLLGGSHASFEGCTFTDIGYGGSTPAVIALMNNSSPSFERCLIAGNAAASFSIASSTCTLSCTDIHGNTGGDWIPAIAGQLGQAGNISQDPLFCGDENPAAPYSLTAGSPCLPEGNDCGVLIGALGLGCGTTAVAPAAAAPLALAAQPNPFNPQVTLRFGLATAVEGRLEILAVSGRRVRSFRGGRLEAGEQGFVWDGRDEFGRALPSGVYLARLQVPGRLEQVKLVLLR